MSEQKALVTQPEIGLRTFDFVKEEVQNLDKFYRHLMSKGTDYDTIPGTPKPTLLKSGAELLRLRFNFHPQFKIDKGNTDIQKGYIEYDVVCSLYQNEALVAEGVGNANSYESKWRYRWVYASDLPKDFDKDAAFNIFGATRKTAKGSIQYRLINDNPADQANTILKISKKRSFVDAILTATGASRIFTQDVEDMTITTKDDGDFKEVSGSVETQGSSETSPEDLDRLAGNPFTGYFENCPCGSPWNQKRDRFDKLSHATSEKNEEGKPLWHNFQQQVGIKAKELAKDALMDGAMFKKWLGERFDGTAWGKLTEVEMIESLGELYIIKGNLKQEEQE